MCPTCRSRIVVVGRGDDLAYEATFVNLPGVERPPTVEMPKAAAPRNYPIGHEVTAEFTEAGPVGIILAERYNAGGVKVVVCNAVDAGSMADRQGVPAGGVVVGVNGQSARSMPRNDIAKCAGERPFNRAAMFASIPVRQHWQSLTSIDVFA